MNCIGYSKYNNKDPHNYCGIHASSSDLLPTNVFLLLPAKFSHVAGNASYFKAILL